MSEPPPIEVVKSPSYQSIPVSNIWTGLIEREGKLLIFLDRIEPKLDSNGNVTIGKVIRELQVELHFSPQEYKSVAETMNKVVKDCEKNQKTKIKTIKNEEKKPMYT